MVGSRTLILTQRQVGQKINRIAHQIVEGNFNENELYLFGLKDGGLLLAESIVRKLKEITSQKIYLSGISHDKENPALSDVVVDLPLKKLHNKVIILVDDVANTGRALTYALRPFLSIPAKKIRTTVLVDRMHKQFPIYSDYVGLTLATTLQEHISVEIVGGKIEVYLT